MWFSTFEVHNSNARPVLYNKWLMVYFKKNSINLELCPKLNHQISVKVGNKYLNTFTVCLFNSYHFEKKKKQWYIYIKIQ